MVGKQCLKESVGEQRGQKVVKEVLGGGGGRCREAFEANPIYF